MVDDDADMLRLLSLRLKAAGHEVVAVGSAEAAWPSSTLPGRSWC